MSDREFTDGELELVIVALTESIAVLRGRQRQHVNGYSKPEEFEFDLGDNGPETLLGFRDDDPRLDEQLTYALGVLDRLLSERDRRRAVTVQRICEWAEYGLPRASQ